MNDYFGALIRSSSLALSAGLPADRSVRVHPDRSVRLQPDVSSDAPPISSDIIEIHEERAAPSVERHPRAPEPLVAASTERVMAPARPPDVATPAATTSAAVPFDSVPHVAIARPPHDPANEAPILESVRRDPDPVRLAMQWVASDPASRIIGAQPSIDSSAPRNEPLRPHESVVFSEPPQVVTEQVTIETPRRDRANEPVREHAMASTVLAHTSARAVSEHVERGAGRSAVELPHEEVVEISIGSINLHVEAPVPQTIVQAAPPAHPQPARERAARSGLSRRYLRSF